MKRDLLFLLKPNFMDQGNGPYFCADCAQMAGVLDFYPALRKNLEVRQLDFPRPRPELIDLVGEENQSCPVLILQEAPNGLPSTLSIQQAKGRWFIEGADQISRYLAHVHGTGIPH